MHFRLGVGWARYNGIVLGLGVHSTVFRPGERSWFKAGATLAQTTGSLIVFHESGPEVEDYRTRPALFLTPAFEYEFGNEALIGLALGYRFAVSSIRVDRGAGNTTSGSYDKVLRSASDGVSVTVTFRLRYRMGDGQWKSGWSD